ncbi:MAG: hypothetical protein JWN12_536 [Candidatus Saccharibacteria bacterium]|nr:hypothetical protein [Candidatus Saccharibacteria bacterium]
MIVLYFILITLIYARSLRNLFYLLKNILWITHSAQLALEATPKTTFIVCIPAYKEQSKILQTIEYFLSLDYPSSKLKLIIATTQKEKVSATSTQHMVEEYIKSLSSNAQKRVRIVHYPRIDGLMAHQINFAAESIKDELNSAYFVVYNADSRPDPKTFKFVSSTIESYRQKHGFYLPILQQSAVFSSDRVIGQSKVSYLLGMGAAMHQTLWTLTQEITRFQAQSSHVPKLKQKSNILNTILHARYSHSVGHGLFVQGSHFLSHRLPENVLNEDMPYGLLQSSLRNAISPIPLFEVASSPSKVTNVYKQKSVWFNPFFEYNFSLQNILKNKQYTSRFEAYFITAQAYASLLIWLLHSIVWIGSLILSVILGPQFFVAWLFGLILYWFIPAGITTRFIKRQLIPIDIEPAGILTGTAYVLTHSVGPFIAVAKWTLATLKNTKPSKPKTEDA